jgi:hypothetical protein
MSTKLKVLLQRVEAKDYIDIAAMTGAGVSLAKGLASAKLMYGHSFQPSECLKAWCTSKAATWKRFHPKRRMF